MKTLHKIFLLLLILIFAACSQEPAEIHYNSDECAHCKMMIMDPRFAAQIVTPTGKAIKFDAIECMVAYREANIDEMADARLWVNDFDDPGNWVRADRAVFVRSEKIKSPMGESLLALANTRKAQNHLNQYEGTLVPWDTLRAD